MSQCREQFNFIKKCMNNSNKFINNNMEELQQAIKDVLEAGLYQDLHQIIKIPEGTKKSKGSKIESIVLSMIDRKVNKISKYTVGSVLQLDQKICDGLKAVYDVQVTNELTKLTNQHLKEAQTIIENLAQQKDFNKAFAKQVLSKIATGFVMTAVGALTTYSGQLIEGLLVQNEGQNKFGEKVKVNGVERGMTIGEIIEKDSSITDGIKLSGGGSDEMMSNFNLYFTYDENSKTWSPNSGLEKQVDDTDKPIYDSTGKTIVGYHQKTVPDPILDEFGNPKSKNYDPSECYFDSNGYLKNPEKLHYTKADPKDYLIDGTTSGSYETLKLATILTSVSGAVNILASEFIEKNINKILDKIYSTSHGKVQDLTTEMMTEISDVFKEAKNQIEEIMLGEDRREEINRLLNKQKSILAYEFKQKFKDGTIRNNEYNYMDLSGDLDTLCRNSGRDFTNQKLKDYVARQTEISSEISILIGLSNVVFAKFFGTNHNGERIDAYESDGLMHKRKHDKTIKVILENTFKKHEEEMADQATRLMQDRKKLLYIETLLLNGGKEKLQEKLVEYKEQIADEKLKDKEVGIIENVLIEIEKISLKEPHKKKNYTRLEELAKLVAKAGKLLGVGFDEEINKILNKIEEDIKLLKEKDSQIKEIDKIKETSELLNDLKNMLVKGRMNPNDIKFFEGEVVEIEKLIKLDLTNEETQRSVLKEVQGLSHLVSERQNKIDKMNMDFNRNAYGLMECLRDTGCAGVDTVEKNLKSVIGSLPLGQVLEFSEKHNVTHYMVNKNALAAFDSKTKNIENTDTAVKERRHSLERALIVISKAIGAYYGNDWTSLALNEPKANEDKANFLKDLFEMSKNFSENLKERDNIMYLLITVPTFQCLLTPEVRNLLPEDINKKIIQVAEKEKHNCEVMYELATNKQIELMKRYIDSMGRELRKKGHEGYLAQAAGACNRLNLLKSQQSGEQVKIGARLTLGTLEEIIKNIHNELKKGDTYGPIVDINALRSDLVNMDKGFENIINCDYKNVKTVLSQPTPSKKVKSEPTTLDNMREKYLTPYSVDIGYCFDVAINLKNLLQKDSDQEARAELVQRVVNGLDDNAQWRGHLATEIAEAVMINYFGQGPSERQNALPDNVWKKHKNQLTHALDILDSAEIMQSELSEQLKENMKVLLPQTHEQVWQEYLNDPAGTMKILKKNEEYNGLVVLDGQIQEQKRQAVNARDFLIEVCKDPGLCKDYVTEYYGKGGWFVLPDNATGMMQVTAEITNRNFSVYNSRTQVTQNFETDKSNPNISVNYNGRNHFTAGIEMELGKKKRKDIVAMHIMNESVTNSVTNKVVIRKNDK